MRIPKYQWLMQEPNQSCGFCDEVAVTSEFDKNFQLIADVIDNPEIYPDGDYEYNPFSPIIGTTFRFDVNSLPALGSYFTIYVGSKIYIFKRSATENEIIQGNLHVVEFTVINLSGYIARIVNIFNSTIGVDFGTGSSASSNTITTINVPSGSYLDDSVYSLLTNINTVGASVAGMYLKNGFYNATTKQINYLHINDLVSDSMTIRTNVSLEAGKLYRIKYGYATVHNFDYAFAIIGYYAPPTAILIPNFSGGVLEFEFTPTITTVYQFGISFAPQDSTTAELAIDNISVRHFGYQTIQTLEVIDCDGVESEIDYATTVYNENILVELLEAVPSVFRLKITDSDDNIFYSRWYSVKEVDECSGLIKVNWTNNCKFSEVDYKNLPFDNELLLTGVKIKQALELHDNVDSINASGAKISIYKNTQTSYELRLHPYLEDTQNTIERIFEHTYVSINNEEYNAIDVFQVTEIDLGVYTGRVDLLKKGTEIISSICCC